MIKAGLESRVGNTDSYYCQGKPKTRIRVAPGEE